MRILKFGGTSIATPERIQNVVKIILSSESNIQAVIVSAFGGITNMLIEMSEKARSGADYRPLMGEITQRHVDAVKHLISDSAKVEVLRHVESMLTDLANVVHGVSLLKELTPRSLDLLMSFGERLSGYIISEALKSSGQTTGFLDTRAAIKTDDHFGDARVDFEVTNENIRRYFSANSEIQIVTGFIATTEAGEITTLGRSGSDYTASIIAAALNADIIEIWTDVDGVLTANPKQVTNAFSIKGMSYEEAMEMSHFGSKVIHPKAMQPALEQNIPILIKNTFRPEFEGTMINAIGDDNPYVIRGISSISEVTLLRVQGSGMLGVTGISARLFGSLARASVSVILISQASSEHSICIAVTPHDAHIAKRAIHEEFTFEMKAHMIEEAIVEEGLSVIAIVGARMRGTPGIAARVFQALGRHGANVVAMAQGSSELNISIVISGDDEKNALNAIHEAFFVREERYLHLFLVGPGLVGAKLLEQIQQQTDFLKRECHLELKLNAIANSRKMLFDRQGIPLDDWRGQLAEASEDVDLGHFAERIKELNFPHSIFIDCTASEKTVERYEQILRAGGSIVTPNKKANSSTFEQYQKLKELARHRGVKFYYETNVGASLPIISTLQDLMLSGDRILKIETIISGTISYIFNCFDGSKSFSEIVLEAKELGYTEPDPRDDLNGMDVARKLLILAREAGMPCEFEDIKVENILPESCQRAETVEQFFVELQKADPSFENRRMEASKKRQRLLYIATFTETDTTISLQSVDESHPFFHVQGNENIISITTTRYLEKPLVVKGPGAGADVTAAGVFADIIRIGNS